MDSQPEEIVKSDAVGFPEMDYVPFYDAVHSEELTPRRAALRRTHDSDEEEDGEDEIEERYYSPRLSQQEYEDSLAEKPSDTASWVNYSFMVRGP